MTEGRKHYDALVIGSGAAGSTAVKELTQRGLDVLLLEAGRDITEADFERPAEGEPQLMGLSLGPRVRAGLRGQHKQARRAMFKEQTSPFLVNDRKHPYASDGDDFLWIRGQQLGGRLHAYGRMLLRASDRDFKAASRDGHGEDWPISYTDLAPYYDQIEDFVGIYGTAEHLDSLPDGRYIGPSRLTQAEQSFKARTEARWPERHVIPWRYAAPNLRRVPLGVLSARETGRLTIRTDAIVREITLNKAGTHADGAIFVDRNKKTEHRVRADVVVLCASTIESIRLLLNSASEHHPNGLGNSSGLLGRYFMDQTPSLVFGSSRDARAFEADDSAPPDPFFPPAGGVYIPQFTPAGATGVVRGYAVQGTIGRIPVPDGAPGVVGLMGFGEMLPNWRNQVTVHPTRKDAWGISIPNIRISLTDTERVLLREQTRGTREMMQHAGYQIDFAGSTLGLDSKEVFPNRHPLTRVFFRLVFGQSLAIGAAIHECGGARMGSDPARSVLNEYNQSWDVPNLFVTDGSCFVSNGSVGPTLTIMALTARSCEYIADQHAGGALHATTRAS